MQVTRISERKKAAIARIPSASNCTANVSQRLFPAGLTAIAATAETTVIIHASGSMPLKRFWNGTQTHSSQRLSGSNLAKLGNHRGKNTKRDVTAEKVVA